MRVLAGGPARETESELFRLHVEGLEAQEVYRADPDDRNLQVAQITVRHELVPDSTEDPHLWHRDKIEEVAKVRQKFMDEVGHNACVRAEGRLPGDPVWKRLPKLDSFGPFDALFMVDTDVVCGPGVLEALWAVDADVVYGVYWTEAKWGQPGPIAPQVWTHHPYVINDGTWAALNWPGSHRIEVLGGGACTLIRGRGFESHYWPLLGSLRHAESQFAAGWQGGMWGGEDRTFCLGLEARQIKQVAVTGLPIFHVYDEWQKAPEYLENVVRVEVGL